MRRGPFNNWQLAFDSSSIESRLLVRYSITVLLFLTFLGFITLWKALVITLLTVRIPLPDLSGIRGRVVDATVGVASNTFSKL